MAYDPSVRGGFPVGVRTVPVDSVGGRTLPVEVWYPAAMTADGADTAELSRDEFHVIPGLPKSRQDAVRDAALRLGKFPLLLFSHGWGSHRRQSTFLCTHMASRGYVVAAPDHVGNTVLELIATMTKPRDVDAEIGRFDAAIANRPADVSRVIDALAADADPQLANVIAFDRIGMFGHSFGGWTTLTTLSREPRILVATLLAPAGGQGRQADRLFDDIDFGWPRVIPTLLIAAERDSILPLAGMHRLFDATPEPKRMVTLANTDHMHFCDDAARTHEMLRMLPYYGELRPGEDVPPFSELAPEKPVHAALRALVCAQFDAFLGQESDAAAFIARDLAQVCQQFGVGGSERP